ncbi:hypothetical protein VTH06DRAFT_3650 [Thermothelomyces fergusii]
MPPIWTLTSLVACTMIRPGQRCISGPPRDRRREGSTKEDSSNNTTKVVWTTRLRYTWLTLFLIHYYYSSHCPVTSLESFNHFPALTPLST